MHLVDDDEFEIRKKTYPLRVVREYSRVHHVRIRNDDTPLVAGVRAYRLGRVSVVDAYPKRYPRGALFVICTPLDIADHAVDFALLILTQRLRRKKVESARVRIFEERLHHREVVAKRFSRCRWRDDNGIVSRANRVPCVCLVQVEFFHTTASARFAETGIEICGQGFVHAFPFGENFHIGNKRLE
jgi:hypothetical protein